MMNAKDLIALSVADTRMTIANERNKLRGTLREESRLLEMQCELAEEAGTLTQQELKLLDAAHHTWWTLAEEIRDEER